MSENFEMTFYDEWLAKLQQEVETLDRKNSALLDEIRQLELEKEIYSDIYSKGLEGSLPLKREFEEMANAISEKIAEKKYDQAEFYQEFQERLSQIEIISDMIMSKLQKN